MAGAPVYAQSTPQSIGKSQAWDAYTYTESGKKVCYVVSKPTKTAPANVRRGEIYFIVSHRPADNVRDEVSLYVGYPFKKDSASVVIGSSTFDMITDGENAWARDAEMDKTMVQAMIKGSTMTVRGVSTRGTNTTDTYSLLGFTAARKTINEACR